MKKKVLIIVAHPDDETIWMGGTIYKNSVLKKKWDITILSLCRKDDADRAPKFYKICSLLNSKGIISDLEDVTLEQISSSEVINRIKENVEHDYDYIFTHGANGEYGHVRHIDVHKAVIKMIKKGLLRTKKLFFFSYEKINNLAIAKNESDKSVYLKNEILLKKQELIHNVYGFHIGGFEYECCKNLEGFDYTKDKTIKKIMREYKDSDRLVVSVINRRRPRSSE